MCTYDYIYIYIRMCICTYMQYYIHTRSILASLNPVGASFCLFRNVLKQAACFGREKHIETIASACVHHPKIPQQSTTHQMFMKCSWRTNMGATGELARSKHATTRSSSARSPILSALAISSPEASFAKHLQVPSVKNICPHCPWTQVTLTLCVLMSIGHSVIGFLFSLWSLMVFHYDFNLLAGKENLSRILLFFHIFSGLHAWQSHQSMLWWLLSHTASDNEVLYVAKPTFAHSRICLQLFIAQRRKDFCWDKAWPLQPSRAKVACYLASSVLLRA